MKNTNKYPVNASANPAGYPAGVIFTCSWYSIKCGNKCVNPADKNTPPLNAFNKLITHLAFLPETASETIGIIHPNMLSPNTAAADWQTILGLELLDRVTFKRTPTVGNQFNRDALINAIDHQIAPGVWNTQVTLSMRYTSPLTLDDDILGTLDLNYLG